MGRNVEQDWLARLVEQDRLVRRLATQVGAVGPAALDADMPAREWLGDWDRLADARQAYAAQGAVGPFIVPMADGEPITRRMARVGISGLRRAEGPDERHLTEGVRSALLRQVDRRTAHPRAAAG